MVDVQLTQHASAARDLPEVRKIGWQDLKIALSKGFDDFKSAPTHILFLGIIYPLVGLILSRIVFGFDIIPLLFPLAAGFALIGPLAAIGLYELSRRREAGLPTRWYDAFGVFKSPSIGGIAALAALLLVIFLIWVAVADGIYIATFGHAPAASMPGFLSEVFTTAKGMELIVIGNLAGFLFAVLTLIVSAISFPLMLDRKVSPIVAIMTSTRVFLTNPVTMALWGLTVAALLVLGSIPLFLGLAIVVPVLGHATWHLYRRAIV